MPSNYGAKLIETKPFEGQKPGTSGLRKKTKVFQEKGYLENFVQSTFNALPADEYQGATLVASGDGRYFSKPAIQTIIKLAAANGVRCLWVGVNGLMSTPAVSAVIRTRGGGRASGGFILTASHNPGGPDDDFGIKYNTSNGGPAPEKLTGAIYEGTKTISSYYSAEDLPEVDLSKIGSHTFTVQHGDDTKFGQFTVEVIDPVEDYLKLMHKIFDFGSLKAFLARPDFGFTFDGLHGVSGPYAKRIFSRELGVPEAALMNCDPLEDFGGHHPDPNLTYAKNLVQTMGLGETKPAQVPEFGAACDGDADRNMILGKSFFVTPSDSVALLAASAAEAIPYFKGGLKGVARSMPTSAALDRVAETKGLKCFETPTGWKYFGNAMDANQCSICGEESFGTGSDHVREKDGLWAVLAWLSVLAYVNKDQNRSLLETVAHAAPGLHLPGGGDKQKRQLVTVEHLVRSHWAKYGRNYYTRYDYESVESAKADKVMSLLESKMGQTTQYRSLKIESADQFTYTDPFSGDVAEKQGARFIFSDGSRFVFRLSGTGSSGATIRMYIEKYCPPDAGEAALNQDTAEAVKPLVQAALAISDLVNITGRKEPTVIT
jgi:phosphoglucomutase